MEYCRRNNLLSCSEHHAAAIGEYGHIYVWGLNTEWKLSSNPPPEILESSEISPRRPTHLETLPEKESEELAYQLGFYDSDISELKNPVFFQLRHPLYNVRAANVACGSNFTAVIAVDRENAYEKLEEESNELFALETAELISETPPVDSTLTREQYKRGYLANSIRRDVAAYLDLNKLSFTQLFKSSIMREESFFNIMLYTIKSKVTLAELKEFIADKKMKLPGSALLLKPLYELVVKCKQGKGALFIFGHKDSIVPRSFNYLQALPIRHDTLGYFLVNLPLGVSCAKVCCGSNFVIILSHSGHVYSWGSVACAALGKNRNASFTQIKLVPDLYPDNAPIEDIACGSDHCLALSRSRIAFSWGKGKQGQLGNGRRDNVARPEQVSIFNEELALIRAGHNSSFCMGASGSCYAWGDTSHKKFSNSPMLRMDKPTTVVYDFELYDLAIGETTCVMISKQGLLYQYSQKKKYYDCLNKNSKHLEGAQFYQVAACGSSFFALSTRGSIYSWNTDDNPAMLGRAGDVGIPHEISSCTQQFCMKEADADSDTTTLPKEVSSKISSVHCAAENTLLLTDKGEIIMCGSNRLGEMGIAFGDIDDNSDLGEFREFVQIPRLSINYKVKVSQVSCGAHHMLAVTSQCKVLAWGANNCGQLGLKTFSLSQNYPEQIKALEEKEALQVSAGTNHSMVLMQSGEVYSFGSAESGKLGLGPLKPSVLINTPALIEGLKNIAHISCGDSHSLALTHDHVLFLWGNGWNGQLGCGSKGTFNEPRPLLSTLEWRTAVCGVTHTVGISTGGTAYHWGEACLFDEEPELLMPTKVKGIEDIKMSKAFASNCCSAVVTETCTAVYSWGKQGHKRILGCREEVGEGEITRTCNLSLPYGEKIMNIGINEFHGAVVTEQGKVFTWGYSRSGRLGDPSVNTKDKVHNSIPLNLSHLLHDFTDEKKKPKEFISDLQKLLQDEPGETKEKNIKEVDRQIIAKFNQCINTFVEIASKDSMLESFFAKVEHKQLARLQQAPFSLQLNKNKTGSKSEVEDRLVGYASLITTYQVHCCYIFNLLNLNLREEKKIEFLNLIYIDMERDTRLIYTAIYLSKMLLEKILTGDDITFPAFLKNTESEVYKKLLFKIITASELDMEKIRKIAESTIQNLSVVAHDDEHAIDTDPLHTPNTANMNKISAYQTNRNTIDKRVSKLKQVMQYFIENLRKFATESSFSDFIQMIIKDFLYQCKKRFDIKISSFDPPGADTLDIVHTVLNILFEPLCKMFENPYNCYVIVETGVQHPEANFKSLSTTVVAFLSGVDLGDGSERWLNDINTFNKSEVNMKLKIFVVSKIFFTDKLDLEEMYLRSLFLHSLEPFDKDITVNGQQMISLHTITNDNIDILRVNNPSYDPLAIILKVINPPPRPKIVSKHECMNLSLFTRSFRQDQSIVRCPRCDMLVPREMSPNNFKPVLEIYDPMPPNSSTAIYTHILATGPKKNKKGRRDEYIHAYKENFFQYLKDFRANDDVSVLLINVDTANSAVFGIPIEGVDEELRKIIEGNRETSLKAIEENCEFEYNRRKQHFLVQERISKTLDGLYDILVERFNESSLEPKTKKDVLFNVEYGASNLELERFSDSVMFNIYMNKIREYTAKKDMSINLFANLTDNMKDNLRGFMKRSLNELHRKHVIKEYSLASEYLPKNIEISFEIDTDSLIIIVSNSPKKLNICGKDEFREEELLLYEKVKQEQIAIMREETKSSAQDIM